MKKTHIILLNVTTDKDIEGLVAKIEDRAWRMDGTTFVDATLLRVVEGDAVNVDGDHINVTVDIDDDGRGVGKVDTEKAS